MKSIFLLLALCGLLLAPVLSEEESEFERNLKSALQAAKEQLHINDTTIINNSCYRRFGTNFDCVKFPHSGERPSTVHELTPYDIEYVAALGDSVTAAMGSAACTIIDDAFSFRGESWSIGGNKELNKVTTIPNIIKEYNPNVKGFSIKTGGPDSKNAKYNVAVIGAIAQDMPEQAETLVKKMKSELSEEEFLYAWKLVTLWIGGNNLCAYCKDKEKHSSANYVKGIQDALDILEEKLPRTFVNLVQIIDVTRLEPLHGIICDIVHAQVCKCGSDSKEIEETSRMSTEYQEGLSALIGSGRYDDQDDFTVVLQPFFEGVELPYKNGNPDKSYFAPDCFHFSTKGHSEGAKALWKNMLEPVGSKTSGWQLGGDLYCPTEEHKYFYTKKNSPPPSLYGQGSPSFNGQQQEGETNNKNNNHVSAIITGTTVGVAAMMVAIVIATVVLALKFKKREAKREIEKLPLVNNNYY